MRLLPLLKVAVLSLLLSGCVAPLLAMGQGQMMWALLKPMVGLDPNTTNLFEQPVIKTRMTGLLGPHYDTTVQLLRTAGELQQEGPLFYLASRSNPQQESEHASLVWNSQTNQLAALLKTDEQTRVFTEPHTGKAAVWPREMQSWLSQPASPTAPPASAPQAALATPPVTPPESAPAKQTSAESASDPATIEHRQLQDELQAAQQKLKDAETRLEALQAEQETTPAKAEPRIEVEARSETDKLSGEQAEAAMEALLNQ